jgi:hypothetical protein
MCTSLVMGKMILIGRGLDRLRGISTTLYGTVVEGAEKCAEIGRMVSWKRDDASFELIFH